MYFQGSVVTSTLRLNRDGQAAVHVFTVQVSTDSGHTPRTALTMVTVTLTDINDNAPQFSHMVYSWDITEGTYDQPVSLGFVEAYDEDAGDNQRLIYALVNGEHGESDSTLQGTTSGSYTRW